MRIGKSFGCRYVKRNAPTKMLNLASTLINWVRLHSVSGLFGKCHKWKIGPLATHQYFIVGLL